MTRLLTLLIVCWLTVPAVARQSDYVVGAQDQLTIAIWNEPDLSGKFSVDADGTFVFPLIGRIKAGGLKLREIEGEIKKGLSDGYLKNPQVTVSIEEFRSQRIFIIGEVRSPGTYQLTGDMTLIEALARAGSTASSAGDEVLIVRSANGKGNGPILPDQQANAEVVKVNLKELQTGVLATTITLRDGDTIFVPRAQAIYIYGQVRTPGAYAVEKGTTVLQALSLAGGVTDRGSTARIKVIRLVDGKKKEIKVKLTDVVEPGDTIVVPDRFF